MATIGFDFGTSNCAVGAMRSAQPELVSLAEHGFYMPSCLYSASRNTIVNWLYQHLPETEQTSFANARQLALQKGQLALAELKLDGIDSNLSFGKSALLNYLDDPEEGYYIKSPKSFLGATGLIRQQIDLFEDIVAAMMCHIKANAEQNLQQDIEQVVIGKPVNFQGLKGEESNQQALNILTNAAKRVGFKNVEFQFEPVAAGVEFEAGLSSEKRVLVVDIGGGTSDCSMLLMGPELINHEQRSQHILSHSGQRVGGNDFDIQLALFGLMPHLGMNSHLKSGKPLPIKCFSDAVEINNIAAQTRFYSAENGRMLAQLLRDAEQKHLVERLLKVQQQKLSYQLVNSAEQAKIDLSTSETTQVNLDFLSQSLSALLERDDILQANRRILDTIAQLINEAINQAGCKPDVVFVTGGTAKSPVFNQFIKQLCPPETELVVGDYFGSVASGLTRWADKVYR